MKNEYCHIEINDYFWQGENDMSEVIREDIYEDISINQIKADIGFRTLVESVNDNMYVIPEYQRKFIWNKNQIRNLAISLIRGLPIPPIYTYRNEDNQLEILDGQQRVMSLFLYYYGKMTKDGVVDYQDIKMGEDTFLTALENANKIRDYRYIMPIEDHDYDISYASLPKKLQRKIDFATISVVEIKISSPEEKNKILHRIFANLNREGEKLSKQELRNGIYPCPFYDMLKRFNKENKTWIKIAPVNEMDKREERLELLLTLCAFKYYVTFDEESGEFTAKKSGYQMLDEFSELAVDFEENTCLEYEENLKKFLGCFTENFLSQQDCKLTKGMIESLFVVIEKTKLDCLFTSEKCKELFELEKYKSTVQSRTTSKGNMEKRWGAVYEYLSKNN